MRFTGRIPIPIIEKALWIIALVCLGSIIAVLLTGGFSIALFGIPLILRQTRNPLLILTIVSGAIGLIRIVRMALGATGKAGSPVERPTMDGTSRLLLLAVILMGVLIRLPGWTGEEFVICDEGLYAYCGKEIGLLANPFLENVWIDKPPGYFYLLATFFHLFGDGNAVARLVNFSLSILLIPLVFTLGRRWFSVEAGLLAAGFQAINPVDWYHAGLVILDPAMTVWFVLGIVLLGNRRWFMAGICFGLSVATKQTAWMFLPFAGATWWAVRRSIKEGPDDSSRGNLVLGFLVVVIPLLWWSTTVNNLSMFHEQLSGYGGVQLLSATTWFGRLKGWLGLAALTSFTLFDQILIFLVILVVAARAVGRVIFRHKDDDSGGLVTERESTQGFVLAIFFSLPLYLLVSHTIVLIQQHGRYLIIGIPFMALVIGWSLASFTPLRRRPILAAIVLILGVQAFEPLDRQIGVMENYQGFGRVANCLSTRFPPGIAVFESGLEWHLYGAIPGGNYKLRRYNSIEDVSMPDPESPAATTCLIDDVRDTYPIDRISNRLERQGMILRPLCRGFNRAGRLRYVLYDIIPRRPA